MFRIVTELNFTIKNKLLNFFIAKNHFTFSHYLKRGFLMFLVRFNAIGPIILRSVLQRNISRKEYSFYQNRTFCIGLFSWKLTQTNWAMPRLSVIRNWIVHEATSLMTLILKIVSPPSRFSRSGLGFNIHFFDSSWESTALFYFSLSIDK